AFEMHGRGLGTRTCAFPIAGHPALLTKRTIGLKFRARLRDAFGGFTWKRLPVILIAYAIGGAGAGGGVAGASAASRMRAWVVIELTVDDQPRGAWVATVRGGNLQLWTFVAPGAPLPNGTNPMWPGLPPG